MVGMAHNGQDVKLVHVRVSSLNIERCPIQWSETLAQT